MEYKYHEEISPKLNTTNLRVNIGYQIVEIDKLYGPTGGCLVLVRVRVDMPNYEWVFEQQKCTGEISTRDDHECGEQKWFEIARCPLQPSDDGCYGSK